MKTEFLPWFAAHPVAVRAEDGRFRGMVVFKPSAHLSRTIKEVCLHCEFQRDIENDALRDAEILANQYCC